MFKYRFCGGSFMCNVNTKIFSFAGLFFFNSNLQQKTN
jgi:hypothetical protein